MSHFTLLQMTQDILSALDSDKVNSISDTAESEQVVDIIRDVYYELLSDKEWPHLWQLQPLTALGDTSHPNYLTIPDSVVEMKDFRYNKRKSTDTKDKYETVEYLSPEDFLNVCNSYDSSAADSVSITDFDGAKFVIKNDEAPTYWTTFDDKYIVTNSYDSGVDSTLQASKTQVMAYVTPTFTESDVFVPDFPEDVLPYLLAESKSRAFVNLKQMVNEKVEQSAKRLRRKLSRRNWRVYGGIQYPNYGWK